MTALEYMDKHWHVIYTRPRYEKHTARSLDRKGIECYLPLKTELRQWHDRKKKIDSPVFPGYLFVQVDPKEILQVYYTDGFVKFISTEDKPDIIPEEDINSLKRALRGDFEISSEKFHLGDRVQVASGPMKGLQGHLIRFTQHSKLVINIDVIDKSVLVTIPSYFIEKLDSKYYVDC